MRLLYELGFVILVALISEHVFRRPAEHAIFGERSALEAPPERSRWSWLGWVVGVALLATPLAVWLYRRYCW